MSLTSLSFTFIFSVAVFVLYAPVNSDACSELNHKTFLEDRAKIAECELDTHDGHFANQYRLGVELHFHESDIRQLWHKFLQSAFLKEINSPYDTCHYNGYFSNMAL
ncbi:hypothetical protein P879_04472 [Paragonimus westermani]|uniref:Uncharacterized protein n=1 Tax=Paragonimus westermani TaxID=34504 RepID=A0A8T0DET4_9TREM|nr:hypothetical protein P879_04472 [Paragonimus westermani]